MERATEGQKHFPFDAKSAIYEGLPLILETAEDRMSEPQEVESIDRLPLSPRATDPHPRVIGSPLPTGAGGRSRIDSPESDMDRNPAGPPGRALPALSASDDSSGLGRAINAFRSALPTVQRLLPLLDGNIVAAVVNLLTPHHHPQAPAPPPKVDLAPVENGLAQLQTQHQSLRDQVIEQNASLKRVEDQLEMVREATDRNTLEQQELLEDLKTFSNKVKVVAVLAVGLLAISLLVNLVLLYHIKSVFP